MSHRLLVGSVFAPSHRNPTWLRLQQRFLNKTTSDFDYGVFLNDLEPDLFEGITIIGSSQYDHAYGLNRIIEYAELENYDWLLLLDSDCFPIADNWFETLSQRMDGFEAAAAVRYENLDTFPHPLAFLMRREAFGKTHFQLRSHINLLGEIFQDCRPTTTRHFPLLRTNSINLHPILYGVYWNMFYHHGAGSRMRTFRACANGYLPDDPDLERTEAIVFDRLETDPEGLMSFLTGRSIKYLPARTFL